MKIERHPESVKPTIASASDVNASGTMTPSQQAREKRRKKLWHELREAKGIDALQSFLSRIETLENRSKPLISHEEICRIRLQAIESLLNESDADFDTARKLVEQYLLPICLRPRRDIPLQAWRKLQDQRHHAAARSLIDKGDYWASREAREARELLEAWFKDRTPDQNEIAREPFISQTLQAIKEGVTEFDTLAGQIPLACPFHVDPLARDDSETAPLSQKYRQVQAALLTLSAIGYRNHATEDVLEQLIERDDSIGSAALNTLASLGVCQRYAYRIQEILRQQVKDRPQAYIGYAFQELADAAQFSSASLLMERSVHLAIEQALTAPEEKSRGINNSSLTQKNRSLQLRDWHIGGNASLIRVFLSRHPEFEDWHDRMWTVLWTLHRAVAALTGESHATFLGTGGKFLSCNNPWMPRDILTSLIPSFGQDPGNDHHAGSHFLRSLSLESLDKCVEPRALAGLRMIGSEMEMSLTSSFEINFRLTPDGDEVLKWLQEDAVFDTHYSTPSDNSLRKLKRQAWRLILSLGIEPPADWVKRAFENEKSGRMRGDVCDILAQLRLKEVPDSFFELTLQPYNALREPPYDEFLSRMGAQRVLANSITLPAFKALLNAGFTMDGDLMRATIDHLAGCAFELHETGTPNIIEDLIEHAMHAHAFQQREAAIGALRVLAVRRCIHSKFLSALLLIANDETIRAYARALIVEALSHIDANPHERELITAALQEIFKRFSPASFPSRRDRSEYDLGWSAAETLIKIGAWQEVRGELFERLSIQQNIDESPYIEIKKELDTRASTVLGLLWKQDERRWSDVVADVISHGSLRAIAPLLKAITDKSKLDSELLPDSRIMIAKALLSRIRQGQSQIRAETSLFEPLALLFPEHLLSHDWENQWRDWLPDARLALAEAIGSISNSDINEGRVHKAVELLRTLTGDGQFAVRRAAYRFIRELNPSLLWILCSGWASANDSQLRQRAAEAIAWLPEFLEKEFLEDEDIQGERQSLIQLLKNDREREVRDAAKLSQVERRKRELADQYLQIVEDAIDTALSTRAESGLPLADTNQVVLNAYRYGRALIHVGQDNHLNRLREVAQKEGLPLHMRHWINEIIEPLESNWKQVTQKWPQPWLPWKGDVEELDGFVWKGNEQFRAHFSLWRQEATDSQGYPEWGGAILPRQQSMVPELLKLGELQAKDFDSWALFTEIEIQIQIPGRKRSIVFIRSAASNRATLISSNEIYPGIDSV